MTFFFDEDPSSPSFWSNCKTSFKFLVRCSLELEPARKAANWDFWLRNNEVSRSTTFNNSGWDLNQSFTWPVLAFDVSNWFHHLTKACHWSVGNCLVLSVLLYLYCQEKIQDKAKLEKYFKSTGIHDSWELNILVNCANPCWTCSGKISGIGPK